MLSFIIEELKTKQPYQPQGPEADDLQSMKADYRIAYQEYFKPNRWLQRKGVVEYMQKCEDSSIGLWTPTRKDSWRNNLTSSIIQEKQDAIVASVADLNLQPEIRSFSMYGNELNGMADALESLIEVCDVQNNTEDKDRYHVRDQLTYGTIAKEVQFVTRMKKGSLVKKENAETGEVSVTKVPETVDGYISTSTIPLDRIILGDVTQPYIWLQPYVFKEYVLKYIDAWAMFHNWPNWKYVKPVTSVPREWGETAAQTEHNYDISNCLVRMVVQESTFLNTYKIALNDVLMTPPGRPMPGKFVDKEYSVAWAPLIPLNAKCAFGESLVYRMRNEAVMRDFFYNALTDRVRQELEPPVVTSFRSALNRQMYRPGSATPVGSDFKVEPLIMPSNGSNLAFEMIQFIEKNISNASVAQVMQGQSQAGGQTAFEIREQIKNSLRVMWNVFSAVAEVKRQETNLKLRLIMEHYPEMGVSKIDSELSEAVGEIKRIFSTRGQAKGGEGERNVAFASLGDKNAFNLSKMLERDELAAKEFGTPRKWHVLDPDTVRKSKHMVYVIVNPTQRRSKQADKMQIMQDYQEFAQNPRIDQDWNTRMRLKASGHDPEEAMVKDDASQGQVQNQVMQGIQRPRAAPGIVGGQSLMPDQQAAQANAIQSEML